MVSCFEILSLHITIRLLYLLKKIFLPTISNIRLACVIPASLQSFPDICEESFQATSTASHVVAPEWPSHSPSGTHRILNEYIQILNRYDAFIDQVDGFSEQCECKPVCNKSRSLLVNH